MRKTLNSFLNSTVITKKKNILNLKTPYSSTLFKVLNLLIKEGYILRYKKQTRNKITVSLKKKNTLKITPLSSPTIKKYISYKELVALVHKNPLNTYVIHTNFGILTHENAIKYKVGGQLFCKIYFGR